MGMVLEVEMGERNHFSALNNAFAFEAKFFFAFILAIDFASAFDWKIVDGVWLDLYMWFLYFVHKVCRFLDYFPVKWLDTLVILSLFFLTFFGKAIKLVFFIFSIISVLLMPHIASVLPIIFQDISRQDYNR